MPGKLLITGGNGMVGRNLREHLGLKGWAVLSPDRGRLDLTDQAATEIYVREEAPDIIVHAAGRVGGIQANIAHPVAFLVENLDIGRNVILAAARSRVPHLLNLGSSCMYPRDRDTPLREDELLDGKLEPTNEGYALAKILSARLCQYIRRENPDLQYKTLIPCNLYGRYDKFDPENSHLIPAIIAKIHHAKINGDEKVEIWGDGRARREFMYAGDFVDSLVRAIGDVAEMPDLMNIGLGRDHSIDEYYEAAARAMDWHGTFVHNIDRPVGMSRKLVDNSLQKKWGWNPTVSLETGIRETYDYYLREAA